MRGSRLLVPGMEIQNARRVTEHPPASLAALRHRYGRRYRWYVLLTVMMGTMASIMASTIVNVAVPDSSLHFALGDHGVLFLGKADMLLMNSPMFEPVELKHRLFSKLNHMPPRARNLASALGRRPVAEIATGYELLRHLRADESLRSTPFIMVTAESKTENVIAAKKAGVSNYIVKPFNAQTLKTKIEGVCGV